MSYNPNSVGSEIKLTGSTSGTVAQFASAITTSYALIWPDAQAAASGYVLVNDGAGNLSWGPGGGGGGAVSSVALSLPSIFTVSGSPITSSGTLTGTLAVQAPNTIFAGPTSGGSAIPAFRLLVSADIPNNTANTTGTATNITATSNSTITTLSALSLPYSQITGAPTSTQKVDLFTLNNTDITNGFVTLSAAPTTPSATILLVENAGNMFYGVDFNVSGSQLIWTGFALNGILASGDNLTVTYST
jgi:hypothetical protein